MTPTLAPVTLAGRQVDRLGLSCLSLTGPGAWGLPADPAAAVGIVRAAVDSGVCYLDTSDAYGPGVSEALIAEALRPYRDDLVIGTKAGFVRREPEQWSHDATPAALRRACEASLRRLGVDRIDLFQLHAPDPAVPLAESVGAMAELRAEGKVAALGVCNLGPDEVAAAHAEARIETVMVGMRDQRADLPWLLDLCAAEGLTFLHWPKATLGNGLLPALARLAGDLGVDTAAVTVAWLLASNPAFLAIPGARSLADVTAARTGAHLALATAHVDLLDRIYLGSAS